jgi:hypothetical protein
VIASRSNGLQQVLGMLAPISRSAALRFYRQRHTSPLPWFSGRDTI